MTSRVLHRPVDVHHFDDEGAWDCPCTEAGDD